VLKDAGFAAGTILAVGPIAETIVAQAKSGKFDLICIGTRGMTATGNLLLGSVATRVLHLADMPVITVR
jgi:nucleotide-binding universal stress UspA family protein